MWRPPWTCCPKNVRNVISLRFFSTIHDTRTRQRLRELLRHTAQPVAVVTSLLRSKKDGHPYHGATLSSFASIAMDPYPLISFALRIPSRMASSLKAASPDENSHMVVNILSAEQASVAVKFSRADLYPQPFHSVPYTLSEEGIPVLEGSLGAISCKLASDAIPLHEMVSLEEQSLGREGVPHSENMVVSELFIARVTRVEALDMGDADEEHPRTLPLLYHRRGYTSCYPPKPK
ncbi:flavin reductase like domain-containing protein [Collybia nuda]|uniref:Flavin reductase like domain-containing protein n=1 Tax=Collybia nuda TaxID=64659 RepID=A0A9P6CCU4_9AGAR|nr:flavin reductase like domain-containing protein [Collybia nuda]